MPSVTCPRCHSNQVYIEDGDYACVQCGNRWPMPAPPKKVPPRPFITIKPVRRLHGISAKESKRLWAKSPAGRESRRRYNHSELFRLAHARHRKTQKYKETRHEWFERQKLYADLLYGAQKPDCPLRLIEGGDVMDKTKCDLVDGNCKFGCFKEV